MWRDEVEVEGSNLGRSVGFLFFSARKSSSLKRGEINYSFVAIFVLSGFIWI